ncbi:MAG TPA: hypothetical protein VK864_10770 [Longimicrobiales bacterium]|nr:hypothetical protein [Longimicrobiales bacterium]
MFIRKVTINWRYTFGEIAIIVMGILIAIALDNCNDARNARRLESEYIARLTEDLRTDTMTFGFVDRALTRKVAALSHADSIINARAALGDTLTFLQDLINAANFSWNQPRVRTTTFQELQSTGNLRLISDPEIRAMIVRYYTSAEGDYLRIAARQTRYGDLTYELLPRKDEFVLDSAAARSRMSGLTNNVLRSDISGAIMAERNYATFISSMNAGLQQRALELLGRLATED